MKSIDTLVGDIHKLVESGSVTEKTVDHALSSLKTILMYHLNEESKKENRAQLRMSNFGTNCDRRLWYQVNTPDEAEKLAPHVRIKFLYGHLIEWLALFLAEAAGHSVEGQQDRLEVKGVIGHRDAIIDGVLVDVKSANSRGFGKFRNHELERDDPFGYLYQLSLYLEGSRDDDKVLVKKEAAFLAVDKELGHIVVDKYKKLDRDWEYEIAQKKAMLASPEPPRRGYSPVPHNKSGNMQLDLPCRYCAFKQTCYPETRTFLYSTGPVYLTKVIKTPEVEEIK